VTGRRVSWWTRWPDQETGPLWVGLHADERGGDCAVVGVEVWTEPPGDARSDAGPPGDLVDQLARSAPPKVQKRHLDLPLGRLVALMVDGLPEELANQLRTNHVGPGRPAMYDHSHYERVAGVYLRDGTRGVVREWRVSAGNARGWVAKCRALGLLQEAPPVRPWRNRVIPTA
jgi:hypothetical protein